MLATQYDSNARVTNVVDKARIVIVPMINVDSFVFTQQAFSPTDTFWYGGTPAQPIADTPLPPNTPQFPGQDIGSVVFTGEQAVGAQAYRRKTCSGAFPAGSPCEHPVRHRPEPQLRRGMGRHRRELVAARPHVPRAGPVVRARDAGGPRVLAEPPDHEHHHDPQRGRARAAPTGPQGRRPRARRAAHEGARRRDGGRHRLPVAVRLAALRHVRNDGGLELRRSGRVRLHDRGRPRWRPHRNARELRPGLVVPHAVRARRRPRVDRLGAERGPRPARGAAARR